MKNILLPLLMLPFLIVSCESTEVDETAAAGGNSEYTRLVEENKQLKSEIAEKDSTVNAFFDAMNEIEDNLLAIYEKEGNIAKHRLQDVELAGDSKTRITEEINAINELMAENKKKISRLYGKLETANGDITRFQSQLTQMETMLNRKDEEIVMLRDELTGMNIEMDMLYTENEDMANELEWQELELNTAFYAYGTSKELKEAGVITKDGGFIGIGKSEKLSTDFNRDYFTRIDITETTQIDISAKKAKLITNHPDGTFEFLGEDPITGLSITSNQEFWSSSKYLVIVVD